MRGCSSLHSHNEAKRTAELLPRLEAGERIALASDAGLPGVNDPGALLVRAALEHGLEVTVLPGPSAVETALVASGLIGERYTFLGYLPRTRAGLDRLWESSPAGPGRRSPSSRRAAFPRRLRAWRTPTPSGRWPSAVS